MTDRIKIDRPVIVEGKYDKIKLSGILDAEILTTDGFGIFNSEEKTALIRRLAEKHGLIVLTDSDGAGLVIRNYFNSILPKDRLIHLYIPEIIGKERRKMHPSRAGTLGVEGMETECLRRLFEPFAADRAPRTGQITKSDFYLDGFSGTEESGRRRAKLAEKLGLPANISANALLAAVNMLFSPEEYRQAAEELDE